MMNKYKKKRKKTSIRGIFWEQIDVNNSIYNTIGWFSPLMKRKETSEMIRPWRSLQEQVNGKKKKKPLFNLRMDIYLWRDSER